MKNMFENQKPEERQKQMAKESVAAPSESARRRKIEEKIDRDLADSFPASDPPGWTLGVSRRL